VEEDTPEVVASAVAVVAAANRSRSDSLTDCFFQSGEHSLSSPHIF